MKQQTGREELKTTCGIVATIVLGFIIFMIGVIYVPWLQTKDEVIKVAAIGDSITQGVGVFLDDGTNGSYPSQLQSLLGGRYRVTNYGLGGRSLLSTDTAPYTNDKFYKESQMANPDIVLIMLGTNDSSSDHWNADLYEKELIKLVGVYTRLPSKPKVYLLTVPAARVANQGATAESISARTIKNEVVPLIVRVARITKTPIIDIYAATKDHLDLFPDGVHPNAEGYKIIAEKAYASIRR